MRLSLILVAIFMFLVSAGNAQAKTNILFIVDGSNSMWGQIDDVAKVETARKTLSELVSDLPKDADLALMAYGHTREGDCSDVELLSDLGKDKPEMITTLIHTIQPTGKTPIANALKKAKDVFKGHEGESNHILLVSDGIESCEGDPCAAAKELQDAGMTVKAHVVGFGVSKEEGKQLTCIADNTGGKYFDAANADAFGEAIEEVKVIAEAAPAPEPEPVKTAVFEDDFKGKDLNPHWEVINEDPNNYIVDDGQLTVIMPGKQIMPIGGEGFPNIFKASEAMPDGDWVIEATFTPEIHTSRDRVYIGVMDDEQNWIAAGIESIEHTGEAHIYGYLEKIENGEPVRSQESIAHSNGYLNFEALEEQFNKNFGPITVKLVKSGRDYTATYSYKEGEEEKTLPLETVKMLRPKTHLFVAIGQADHGGSGDRDNQALESYLNLDSIKVIEVK